MTFFIPSILYDLSNTTDISWQPIIYDGLHMISKANRNYLPLLVQEDYLPTEGRLFAAFKQPLNKVQYILIGESPYPRIQSATGLSFIDGAVNLLWSDNGFSKEVNRATSLRNFIKMLLVASKKLEITNSKAEAIINISRIARENQISTIQTLVDFQNNLFIKGFLLLNASLVFRKKTELIKDAKIWQLFLKIVLQAFIKRKQILPTLILLGKIAQYLNQLPETKEFPCIIAEHPYNLSFIKNQDMHQLFGAMRLLNKPQSI